jgi:hypothetical protein
MNVLVTSPLRTGSTWVCEMLAKVLRAERTDFVSTVASALQISGLTRSCVLKSHTLIDLDVLRLKGRVHSVRILRNYKDCLISRALYCRNVRSAEGQVSDPNEDAVIGECIGLPDRVFVNIFLATCPNVAAWMENLVVYERGDFDHTFYYEMLLHNTKNQLLAWIEKQEESESLVGRLDEALEYCNFRNMQARKTRRFMASTGVGQWIHWLDEPVWRKLDRLYHDQTMMAARFTDDRFPVTLRQGEQGGLPCMAES